MKNRALALVLALTLVPCGIAPAATKMLISTAPIPFGSIVCGGTDSGSYGEFTGAASTAPYAIGTATSVIVTLSAAVNSTSTVLIKTGPTSAGPWYTVATISNLTTTGEQWSIPQAEFIVVTVSSTNQTLRFCLTARREDKQVW